jgi:hypothetical protein
MEGEISDTVLNEALKEYVDWGVPWSLISEQLPQSASGGETSNPTC